MKQILFLISMIILSIGPNTLGQTGYLSSDEQTRISKVVKEIGPLVEDPDIEPFRQKLEHLTGELSSMLQTELGKKHMIISDLHLVDSQQINALALPVSETNVGITKAHMFVTQGLVRWYINQAGGDYQKAMYYLAGVLSHEVAHLMDKYSSDSVDKIKIENHYRRAGSQAIEIKADSYGMFLLRKLRMDPRFLYEAIQKLPKLIMDNVIHSATSTHPDIYLRESFARLFLTGYDMKKGGQTATNLELVTLTEDETTAMRAFEKRTVRKNVILPFAQDFKELNKQIADFVRERGISKSIALEDLEDRDKPYRSYEGAYGFLLNFNYLLQQEEMAGRIASLKNAEVLNAFQSLSLVVKLRMDTMKQIDSLMGHRDFGIRFNDPKMNDFLTKLPTHFLALQNLKFYDFEDCLLEFLKLDLMVEGLGTFTSPRIFKRLLSNDPKLKIPWRFRQNAKAARNFQISSAYCLTEVEKMFDLPPKKWTRKS